MTSSRRRFLQAVGISLAATQLGKISQLNALDGSMLLKGRVLYPATVGGKTLWPDSVVTILDMTATHYRLPEGDIAREGIQPLYLDRSRFDGHWAEKPSFAEITAPAAAVFRHADAASGIVGRLGHGAVAAVSAALPDGTGQPAWLQVHVGTSGPGWIQAQHAQPCRIENDPTSVDHLVLDHASQTLTGYRASVPVLSSPISTPLGPAIPTGTHAIELKEPVIVVADGISERHLSWTWRADRQWLFGGVYWHNGFGLPKAGPAVQLPMPVARLLYPALGPATRLIVT